MEILSFREYEKNTLKGFVDIKLRNGIILKGFTLHTKNSSVWVNPPAKKYTDDDGKEKYDRIVDFESKEIYQNFNKQAVKLLKDYQSKKQGEPNNA